MVVGTFKAAQPEISSKRSWRGLLPYIPHCILASMAYLLTMVLLTTLLTPLAFLTSFNIKDHVKAFMILFLLLETGMLGVFVSLDLLFFFVFWEIGLVPMYFLINQWGARRRRGKAQLCFIEIHPLHHGWFTGLAARNPDDWCCQRDI